MYFYQDVERELTEYELIELLGEGGFGRVYSGTQKSTNSPVAIKVSFDDYQKVH